MKTVISRDGTAIAYDQVGQGPAVILVAGAFSYRKYPGSMQLADLLAKRFTVFNYDRRGRGDSGDTKPYMIDREIEDIQAAHRLGWRVGIHLGFVLWGHSCPQGGC